MPKWLSTTLHVAAIGLGAYAAHKTGQPWYLIASSAANALLPSPLVTPAPAPQPTKK